MSKLPVTGEKAEIAEQKLQGNTNTHGIECWHK